MVITLDFNRKGIAGENMKAGAFLRQDKRAEEVKVTSQTSKGANGTGCRSLVKGTEIYSEKEYEKKAAEERSSGSMEAGASLAGGEKESYIDVRSIQKECRKLKSGLIAPSEEVVTQELAVDHAAEPIKDMDEIERISDYMKRNGRYRDNMLFIVGINLGLRISDLRVLRFCNLINDNYTFKDSFPVLEQKTKNTRTHRKNRYLTINTAIVEAVTLYLENTKNVKLSDYMFRSESNRGSNKNEPVSRQGVDHMLRSLAKELDLTMKLSTHSLRKTWAYHQMVMSNNDPRKLLLLQKAMGHSSAAQTLDYIGITREEIEEAYRNLNLGSKTHNYLVDSSVTEREDESARAM